MDNEIDENRDDIEMLMTKLDIGVTCKYQHIQFLTSYNDFVMQIFFFLQIKFVICVDV